MKGTTNPSRVLASMCSLCFLLGACGGGDDGGGGGNGGEPGPTYTFSRCLGNTTTYAAAAPASLDRRPCGALRPGSYVPGEVLVKLEEGASAARVTAWMPGARVSALKNGFANPRSRAREDWLRVGLPAGTSVPGALDEIAAEPGVRYVQPNYVYTVAAAPTDPDYGQLWGLENGGQRILDPAGAVTGVAGVDMNLEPAWDTQTDCSSVRVAVVDSGINYNHEDLRDAMWDGQGCPDGYGGCPNHGYDFVDGDNDPMDLNGHGTHVAGSIGATANNAVGVSGVCWRSEIVAVRVMDAAGAGTSADIAAGMNFAVQAGARVINMSVGGGGPDQLMYDAAVNIRDAGAILVSSAGNASRNNDVDFSHPGCFNLNNIVNVAAVDPRGNLADFSNYGAVAVDLAGPGVSVLSTYAGRETTLSAGGGDWYGNPAAGGWGFDRCQAFGAMRDVIADPSDFCSGGAYLDDIDHRAWTQPDLSLYDSAHVYVYVNLDLEAGDYGRVACRAAGGDPFAGGTTLFEEQGIDTDGFYQEPLVFPLDKCTTRECTFGFQLQSNAAGTAQGMAVVFESPSMDIVTLRLADNRYTYLEGTSMAAPNVAGVAALLWAEYPQATYRQIILALFDGTRAMDSLEGKTCTGGMVDAQASLDLLAGWLQ